MIHPADRSAHVDADDGCHACADAQPSASTFLDVPEDDRERRRHGTAPAMNAAATARHLERANIILCLVSPDFIASKYCYSREMERALQRHRNGEPESSLSFCVIASGSRRL